MRTRFLTIGLAVVATAYLHAAETERLKPQGNHARTLFPSLTVEDSNGHSVPLLSLQAYQAEFRYLKRTFLQTDLKGPAIVTDGWTTNISEAEWPFMAFAYFGYACANLARLDRSLRSDALAETRWLIDALQTPRMSGFVTPHFGEPFGNGPLTPSVIVHGHFLNLAVRYREVSGDARYDPLIRRVAGALNQSFQTSRQGILKSYRDMWWISDNLPALSALARYDRIYRRDTSAARNKFLQHVKAHYLDASTGLLCTYVDADNVRPLQGARGISTMYGLHFLRDIDASLATNQYRLARRHFVREILGVAAVREFAEGTEAYGDIDSGPLVFGFGPSASGFAIAAAAVMQDRATAEAVFLAAEPTWEGWLDALKQNRVAAIRRDPWSGGKTWMHAASRKVLELVRARERDWRWWDNPDIQRPLVSLVAVRPDDEFETARPENGMTLRIRCAWENTPQGLLKQPIVEFVKLTVDGQEVTPTLVSGKRPNGPLLDDHYHQLHLPNPAPGRHVATVAARVIATKAEVTRTIEFTA